MQIRVSTVCPTRYRTRHSFNNSSTNEDIATRFEQEYVRFVRNEEECVCSAPNILISGTIIKEMAGSVASGTHCIFYGRTRHCIIWRYVVTMSSASGRAVRRQTIILVRHISKREPSKGVNCFSTTHSNRTHFMRSFWYIIQFTASKTQIYYIIVIL